MVVSSGLSPWVAVWFSAPRIPMRFGYVPVSSAARDAEQTACAA